MTAPASTNNNMLSAALVWALGGTAGTIATYAAVEWLMNLTFKIPDLWIMMLFWNAIYVGGAWACLGFLDREDYDSLREQSLKQLWGAFALGFTGTILFAGAISLMDVHAEYRGWPTLLVFATGLPFGIFLAQKLHGYSRRRTEAGVTPVETSAQDADIEAVMVYTADNKLPTHHL